MGAAVATGAAGEAAGGASGVLGAGAEVFFVTTAGGAARGAAGVLGAGAEGFVARKLYFLGGRTAILLATACGVGSEGAGVGAGCAGAGRRGEGVGAAVGVVAGAVVGTEAVAGVEAGAGAGVAADLLDLSFRRGGISPTYTLRPRNSSLSLVLWAYIAI